MVILCELLMYLAWSIAGLLLLWILVGAVVVSRQSDEDLLNSLNEEAYDETQQQEDHA